MLLSDIPEETGSPGLLQRFFHLLFVAVGEGPQVVEGEPLPQDARLLQRLPSFRPQAGGPLGDDLAHAFGDFYPIQLPADPTSLPHEEVPAFDERLQHLGGEEGVALGVGVHQPCELLRHLHPIQPVGHQCGRLSPPQMTYGYPLDELLATQVPHRLAQGMSAPDFHVAVGANEQYAIGACMPGEVLQEIEARFIRPVQIVYEEGDGAGGGDLPDETVHRPQELL